MNKTGMLYYTAGALALVAGLVVIFSEGFIRDEYGKLAFYFVWAALMMWLGYRQTRRAS
jgi:hypothetical protein